MFHLTTALDPASDTPLYEQLYESLAEAMRAGELAAGTRMPGKRRLAAELSVSVNTVDGAYQILAAEGYLEAKERSGFYVQEYLALPTRPKTANAAPGPRAAEHRPEIVDKVCVWLSSAAGEVYVCENAAYHPYSEDEAAKVLAEHDVLVKVDMGTGDASAKAWGCDLTYDYVKINGDYRT